MPPRIEDYQGREQSFIKHLFLNKYLEAAAYKLFQGRSPVFNFVDAFAGPWRVSDTNTYSDASFSQAIETLETVRRSLHRRFGQTQLRCRQHPAMACDQLDKLLAFVLEGDGQEGGAGGSVPPVTIPEPPRNPASRTGDLWILGDHRLLCGDSTSADDVRRLMNGERAILFATDPPYLVDYDGSNHPTRNKDWSASYGTTWDDSSQGAELYDGFIAAAVAEAITEDAAWYCWHASRRQAMLEACWEKAGAFVHQQIIWVKDRGVLTRSHYLWKHEPCFMGWRRPNRPPKVAEETLPSTWALPSFAKDERPDHPTPKPLDAFGIPMRQHVARGGLCYEPFSGSGSQIMAGEANGRRVFAMEISPAYVDVAVERWQADTGKEAILDGDGRTFAQVRTERLGGTLISK